MAEKSILQEVKSIGKHRGPDRASWHKPLISIVITHFNYADHIEDAILSLIDQSHENWECVIVDDASSCEQHAKLVSILDHIANPKIRLAEHAENLGQIPAFFTGLDATSGDFVCLLDPDDRYAKTFLEEALACHLNETVYCPIVCTEQMLLTDRGVITGGGYSRHNCMQMSQQDAALVVSPPEPRLLYFEAHARGWFWTSTSAMMFRRAALNVLRPHRSLGYKGSFDSYMAQGAHLLGGTLFYTKPLIYRGLHVDNAYITADIYASAQDKAKTYGEERTTECLEDALDLLRSKGVDLPKPTKKRGLIAKWRRSLEKRWPGSQ
jgi:glycosyltransferase involved in cell wall biosynthesis